MRMKSILFIVGLLFAVFAQQGCATNKGITRECNPTTSGISRCQVKEDPFENFDEAFDRSKRKNKEETSLLLPPTAPRMALLPNEELVKEMDPIAKEFEKWCPIQYNRQAYIDVDAKWVGLDYFRYAQIRAQLLANKTWSEWSYDKYPYDYQVDYGKIERMSKYACRFLSTYYERRRVYEDAIL